MSSRSEITATSPAPYTALLEAGGSRSYLRRVFLAQRLVTSTIAYHIDGELLAVGMLWPYRKRRVEFGLAVTGNASPHMLALVRIAQLTLSQIAQSGVLVIARINPANDAGARMARMVGFRRSKLRDPYIWIWRGTENGWHSRGRRCRAS